MIDLNRYTTSSLKEKILSGGAWAIVLKIATGALALLVNILLVRTMTMEEVGSYFITHNMITICSLVAQFGLPQLAIRLVSENMADANLKELKSNIYSITIISLLSCFSVGVVLISFGGEWLALNFFKDPKIVEIIELAAFWMVALSFQQIIVETFRGLHDIKMATLFGGLISNLIVVIVLSIMISLGISSFSLVIKIFTATALISVMISAFYLSGRIKASMKEKFDFRGAQILREAWPLWITSISVYILGFSDLWIVTYFLSKTDIALYGSSAKLLITISLVVSLSYAVLPPIISEMSKKGEFLKLQSILRSFAFGNTLVAAPIFIVIAIFPGHVLNIVFGENYAEAGGVLVILAFGKLFNVVTGIRGYTLLLTGYGALQMKISLFAGFITIVLCSLGAMSWGIIGVSCGAVCAMIIQCSLEMAAVKRKLGVWTHLSFGEFKSFINFIKQDG